MLSEHEIEAIATGEDQLRKSRTAQMIAALRMAAYRKRVEAYQQCFLGVDGELTDAARIVIADLSRLAGLGSAPAGLNDMQLREAQGGRRVVLRIFEFLRLDPAKMRRLAAKLRETRT